MKSRLEALPGRELAEMSANALRVQTERSRELSAQLSEQRSAHRRVVQNTDRLRRLLADVQQTNRGTAADDLAAKLREEVKVGNKPRK